MEYKKVVVSGREYLTLVVPTFRIWLMDDVLLDGYDNSIARFIPGEHDLIYDPHSVIMHKVIDIDPITHISKIEPVINQAQPLPFRDPLINPIHRIYIDRVDHPYSCTVDVTYSVGGPDLSHAIIHRGVNPGDNTTAISEIYNADGSYGHRQVPLVRITSDSHEPHNLWNVGDFKTTWELENGDVVTMIIFDVHGQVVSKVPMMVEDVSHLNDHNISTKTIESIELYSPFMDINGRVLNRPISLDMNDLNMVCIVHYNDGNDRIVTISDVDGDGQARLLGLEVVGLNNQALEHDVVLRYNLKECEVANAPLTTTGRFIAVPYLFKNYAPHISYNTKLHVYPVYVNSTEGYRLVAKLLLPDRSGIIDVTNSIRYNGSFFSGKLLSVEQTLDVYIDLGEVNGIPNDYDLHTHLSITLNHYGGESGDHWIMYDDVGTLYKSIRPNMVDISATTTTFSILPSNSTEDEINLWWNDIYKRSRPMILRGVEIDPPVPTHIELVFHDNSTLRLNKDELTNNITIEHLYTMSEVIDIRFLQVYGDSYLELSIFPLTFL